MSGEHSHGYLPAGRYIVNHDIMRCTADGVVGNDLYSGRALGRVHRSHDSDSPSALLVSGFTCFRFKVGKH